MTNKQNSDEKKDKTENKSGSRFHYYLAKDNIIWSWFGYSKDNEPVQENKEPVQENKEPVRENSDSVEGNMEIVQKDKNIKNESTDKKDYSQTDKDNKIQEPKKKGSSWLSFITSPNSTVVSETVAKEIEIPKNIVLPMFESQFAVVKEGSLFTKALYTIKNTFFTSPVDSMKQNMYEKKIAIVGVHGWFPTKFVRSVVGEPTGTSYKFCEQMRNATKNYFLSQYQLELSDQAIVTIPLFWEGKIQTRVDRFEEQINKEWADQIKKADIILWATHSQGTPVSVILMHRLIVSGIIRPNKQPTCMLAMAGISHGPFPALKGNLLVKYFEADAARELFEFMDSESEISIVYRNSMTFLLEHPVKIVFVGSMQDQVVPLYSAIMSGLSHPNILRAIYIDSYIYSQDDFLIRLIAFALKLLNLGFSDHDFLIHISEVLAGNIYSFEGGHSTLYEESDVFTLPLQYLFETHPLGLFQRMFINSQAAVEKARIDPFQAKMKLNPYHLPWVMRGIWDDPRIMKNQELRKELEQLQTLFDHWNPTSTRLKEIKFRLEPLKARL